MTQWPAIVVDRAFVLENRRDVREPRVIPVLPMGWARNGTTDRVVHALRWLVAGAGTSQAKRLLRQRLDRL